MPDTHDDAILAGPGGPDEATGRLASSTAREGYRIAEKGEELRRRGRPVVIEVEGPVDHGRGAPIRPPKARDRLVPRQTPRVGMRGERTCSTSRNGPPRRGPGSRREDDSPGTVRGEPFEGSIDGLDPTSAPRRPTCWQRLR